MKKLYLILYLSLSMINIDGHIFKSAFSKIANNLKDNSYKLGKTFKTAGHWGLSAGPVWLETYNYLILLSEPQALKILGDQDVPHETDKEIREHLQEINFKDSDKIKIKFIKPKIQKYIMSALVCTDNIIFINPKYYNILNNEEKKALITRTTVLIESKHLKQSAIALSLIPVITHIAIMNYEKTVNSLLKFVPNKYRNGFLCKAIKAKNYIIGSCLAKLAVNAFLSSLYLKHQSYVNDIKTIQKIKSIKPLLSYYSKIQEKQSTDDFLLNIIKIPDTKKKYYFKEMLKSSSNNDFSLLRNIMFKIYGY